MKEAGYLEDRLEAPRSPATRTTIFFLTGKNERSSEKEEKKEDEKSRAKESLGDLPHHTAWVDNLYLKSTRSEGRKSKKPPRVEF